MNDDKLRYYSKLISEDLVSKVDPENPEKSSEKKGASGRVSGGVLSAVITVALFAAGIVISVTLAARSGSRNRRGGDQEGPVAGATGDVSPATATHDPEEEDMAEFENAKKITLTLPAGILPEGLEGGAYAADMRQVYTDLFLSYGLPSFDEVEISETGRFRLFVDTSVQSIFQPAYRNSIAFMPARICVTGRIEASPGSEGEEPEGAAFTGLHAGRSFSLVVENLVYRYEDQLPEHQILDAINYELKHMEGAIVGSKGQSIEWTTPGRNRQISEETLEKYVNALISNGGRYSLSASTFKRLDVRMISGNAFLVERLNMAEGGDLSVDRGDRVFVYGEGARPASISYETAIYGATRTYTFDENGLLTGAVYLMWDAQSASYNVNYTIETFSGPGGEENVKVTREGPDDRRIVILNGSGKEIYNETQKDNTKFFKYTAYVPYQLPGNENITCMISSLTIRSGPRRAYAYEDRYLANDYGALLNTLLTEAEVDTTGWDGAAFERYCPGMTFDPDKGWRLEG
jgi:hypothetical protein